MSTHIPQTVLVTGASSGIGLALAESYVRSGAHVVLNARDEGKLRRTAEALGRPEQIALVAGDIAARATAERMVEVARARFGRVDTLINNAGVFAAKPFADYSEVELDAYLDINLRGAFLASQAFVAELRAQGGGGSIVSITSSISISALAAVPASATIAAKGGLNALTRSLALELAPEHIRVNAVAPGLVKTPLHGRTEAEYGELASLQPMGHVGETSDIVDAVRYLASARFVTGVVLPVDGGMSTGRW